MKINDNPAFMALGVSIKNIIRTKANEAKSLTVKASIYLLKNTLGVSNAFIIK